MRMCEPHSILYKIVHERTHTKERPYPCNFCEKRFAALGTRQTHELIHRDEKPHKCSYCEKGFKRYSDKKKHEKIHTRQPRHRPKLQLERERYQTGVSQNNSPDLQASSRHPLFVPPRNLGGRQINEISHPNAKPHKPQKRFRTFGDKRNHEDFHLGEMGQRHQLQREWYQKVVTQNDNNYLKTSSFHHPNLLVPSTCSRNSSYEGMQELKPIGNTTMIPVLYSIIPVQVLVKHDKN